MRCAETAQATTNTSVLVVDDQKAMIGLIRSLLVDLGFQDIRDASDGTVALEKLRTETFGLVLSDLYMEPVSGLDLLRTMRADKKINTIPFVMITASAQPETLTEARALGANGYILKPFSITTLRRTLAKVLGGFLTTGTAERIG